MAYKFLTTNDLSLKSIWAWARQLVNDLNASQSASGQVTPAGIMSPWGGAAAPDGWVLCDGGQYSKDSQPSLFLAIGYTYGGSGDTFNVPDFRDKSLIGAGTLVSLGQTAGASEATLSVDNLPSHNHGVTDPGHTHGFVGGAHTHGISDPGHVHTLTDPGHAHVGGAAAPTAVGATGAASDVVAQANTNTATTGITMASATTGVTATPTAVSGTNSPANTGISTVFTGAGEAFSILGPVVGVNMIIKL